MGHILERCSKLFEKNLKFCSIIALTNHLNFSGNILKTFLNVLE